MKFFTRASYGPLSASNKDPGTSVTIAAMINKIQSSVGLGRPTAVQTEALNERLMRMHREIQHLARLLARVVADLPSEKIDRYLIRDAQRLIEAIETLVRIHVAQEDDIYDAVAST